MIVSTDELNSLQQKLTLVAGGFDPIHWGHLLYFAKAKELGLPVMVSVDPDSYVSQKHQVLIAQSDRCRIINEMKSIDYVYQNPGTTAEALRQIKPKFFLKDAEWRGKLPEEEVKICQEHGIEVIFVDTRYASSSQMMQKLTGSHLEQVTTFADFILQQETPSANNYDSHYFQAEWRGTQNEYTLESRRKIEGRHPEVIKNVFNPASTLDVGCGPGYLIKLLDEAGVAADGVDISSDVLEMAPSEIKERIRIGSIAQLSIADRSYELVICREVLEHLSVNDLFKAVLNMCRVSSRYVYLTTRFHPNPQTLLDVTDEKQVDPTHITLLNKNFLRLMFNLCGFRQRVDLEEQIDWLKKGRVLVYERTSHGI